MSLNLRIVLCVGLWACGGTAQNPRAAEPLPVLEITEDTVLDPQKVYGPIVVKASGVTLDGRGAWLIGATGKPAEEFQGTAISAQGVSNVTIKNLNAKGWETGLHVRDAKEWKVEGCDFSDNFHDPEFGWGENGRRGGIVLENVTHSTLRKNRANRVWDACVLVDCEANFIAENDFSRTSDTCMKLWNSSRNTIEKNDLSYGIRINPGEVHARDSTSVLIESGSNENHLRDNDCTHGGDGIFVRVLNGWSSVDNLFEGNDCSYANNNGIECWAPRNRFLRNKANHCSYGFWLGGSDKTELIGNEASFNGLASGYHNSPHLPENGHAGIVFMFGPSSHTIARDNVCRGNNGAGIAAVGDLKENGPKWLAYHWVIERNTLAENRWGVYLKRADWITLAGNTYRDNSAGDVHQDGDVTRLVESANPIDGTAIPPRPIAEGPTQIKVGTAGLWDASGSEDPSGRSLQVVWDLGDGVFRRGPRLEHTFDRVGFHRIGLNVDNGVLTQPFWQDVYVVRDVAELGTEGTPDDWSIEDFHDRKRSDEQMSQASFRADKDNHLIGSSALNVTINPYAGFRALLTYPKRRDASWSVEGKSKLTFWLKAINADVAGWQGGPFIVLQGEGDERCYLEPKPGRDLMRELDDNEGREGWRLFEIALDGDDRWQRDGELPRNIRAVSLGFDSWGAPPLRLWIDGLGLE
jgi:parallel beta-helix repeat protein